MKYDFDEIIDRRGTQSSKWDGPPLYKENLGMNVHWTPETIPLFHADMDFACPPAMIEALHRVADRRIFGYTNCIWEPRYFDAVVSWFMRRYDTRISPGHILFSSGALGALKN